MKKQIFTLMLFSLFMTSSFALPFSLWQTRNQQAATFMEHHQFKQAEEAFTDPHWQAVAAYRAGEYQRAALFYAQTHHAYNQGNALAHLGQYQQAIDAYTQALKDNPKDEDAAYNKKLIEALMKQKEKPKQNNPQESAENNPAPKQQPKPSLEKRKKQSQSKPSENQQANQHWLKLIPEHPGGLLRQQFLRDHLRRQQGRSS